MFTFSGVVKDFFRFHPKGTHAEAVAALQGVFEELSDDDANGFVKQYMRGA